MLLVQTWHARCESISAIDFVTSSLLCKLCILTRQTWCHLPTTMLLSPMHFEGWNVIIRMAPGLKGTFVLHRDVLADGSSYFGARLADRWHKPRMLENDDEEAAAVWEPDLFL